MKRLGAVPGVIALTLTAALLGACAGEPASQRAFPEIGFAHLEPLRIAAQGPEVISRWSSPMTPPHVEHRLPVTPEQAIRNWIDDRLRPTGAGLDTLEVEILDASVTETPLETSGGLGGLFRKEQEARYTARAKMVIRLVGPDGRMKNQITTEAYRSRTVAEDASLAEREELWFELVEGLVTDLDQETERGLRQYFGDALITPR